MFYSGWMGMTPPKNDAWPQFEGVRFCLLRGVEAERPVQAFLFDTKFHGQTREFQVVWLQESGPDPGVRIDWVRRSRAPPSGSRPEPGQRRSMGLTLKVTVQADCSRRLRAAMSSVTNCRKSASRSTIVTSTPGSAGDSPGQTV